MIDFNSLKSVDIEKLFIFNELCREWSIKKVLLKNEWTPRTIYYTLQTLEKAFNVKLYIKGKRDIILTDEGEKLYNLSMIFLESLKSIGDTKNEDYEGKLTIHSTVGFAHYHLTTAIAQFFKIYPNIKIKSLGGSEYLTTKYLDFDIMIGANPINRSELTKIFLKTADYSFFASQDYLARNPVPDNFHECKNHNFLSYAGLHLVDQNFINNNKIVFESNLYASLIEMCTQGLGIASLTKKGILEYSKQNNLINLFNGHISESEDLYFSYKSYSILKKPIKDLFKILREL